MAKTLRGRIATAVSGLSANRNDSTGRIITRGNRRQQVGGAVGRENRAINRRPATFTVGEARRKSRRANARSLGRSIGRIAA